MNKIIKFKYYYFVKKKSLLFHNYKGNYQIRLNAHDKQCQIRTCDWIQKIKEIDVTIIKHSLKIEWK